MALDMGYTPILVVRGATFLKVKYSLPFLEWRDTLFLILARIMAGT